MYNNFLQLDEVRYAEDKEPLGFEYMRLGLNDVLYDSKTKTVYTPNMNALANLGGSGLTSDEIRCIMELRKKMNWVKGSKGRFAGSVPMGGGAISDDSDKTIKLEKGEYAKIVSEINTNYRKYDGKRICYHFSYWKNNFYTYKFINNGFDDYRFIGKWS